LASQAKKPGFFDFAKHLLVDSCLQSPRMPIVGFY